MRRLILKVLGAIQTCLVLSLSSPAAWAEEPAPQDSIPSVEAGATEDKKPEEPVLKEEAPPLEEGVIQNQEEKREAPSQEEGASPLDNEGNPVQEETPNEPSLQQPNTSPEEGSRPLENEETKTVPPEVKTPFKEGVQLFQEGKLEESVQIFENLSKEFPNDRDVHFYLGVVYLGLRRFQEAEKALNEAIALDPAHLPSHLQLAELYEATQQLQQALEVYDKIIQLDPAGEGARQGLLKKLQIQGILEARAGEYESALRFFNQAAEMAPEDPINYYNIGLVQLRLNQDAKAEEAFQKVVSIDPRHQNAYINLGAIYERRNRFADALEAYRRAVQIDSNNDEGRKAALKIPLLQGTLLALGNRLDEALQVFEQALPGSPEPAAIYFNMALIYLTQGKSEKGEEALLEALKADPKHQGARLSLATLYEGQGKFEEALREYEAARDAQPDSPGGVSAAASVHIVKGKLFESAGKWDEASQEYTTATEMQPRNSQSFFRLGVTYLQKSQLLTGEEARSALAAAEKAFERAASLSPSEQDAYLALGDIRERTGRDAEAIETYEKLIAIGPSPFATKAEVRIHLIKGIDLAQQERYEEARAQFEEVIRLNPKEKNGYLNLGLIDLQEKKGFAAVEDYKKGLELDPTDRSIRLRLASLYGELGRSNDALALYQSILDEGETPLAGEIEERMKSLYTTLSLGYQVTYDSNINLSERRLTDFKSEVSGQYQRLFDLGSGLRAGVRLSPEMLIFHRSQVSFFSDQTSLLLERKGYQRGDVLNYTFQFGFFDGSPSYNAHDLSWERYAPVGRYSIFSGSIHIRYTDSISDRRYSGVQPSVSGNLTGNEVGGGRVTLGGSVFGNRNTETIGRDNAYIGFAPSISYDRPIIPGVIGNLFYSYNFSRFLNIEEGFRKRRLNQGHSYGGGVTVNWEKGLQLFFKAAWSINHSNLAGVTSSLEQALVGNSSLGDYKKWSGNAGLRLNF